MWTVQDLRAFAAEIHRTGLLIAARSTPSDIRAEDSESQHLLPAAPKERTAQMGRSPTAERVAHRANLMRIRGGALPVQLSRTGDIRRTDFPLSQTHLLASLSQAERHIGLGGNYHAVCISSCLLLPQHQGL